MSETSSDCLGFHARMTSLELKLKQSEDERIKLEEKFNQLLKSNKSEEAMQVFRLRENYCQVLERDRERCVRNDVILQTLTRIENRTTALTAKTDRLRLLRHYYEAYMAQHFPRLKRYDTNYSSVFGSTSDINDVSHSGRSFHSPAPSLYSPSPSITRRSSLVIPDYEIMETKYSYIREFGDGSKPVRRRLIENTARSKSPAGYKDSNAENINRDRSAISVFSVSSNIPANNNLMQQIYADPEQNTSNDLLNMSLSEESLNTFQPIKESKTPESPVYKTQTSFVQKTVNTSSSSNSKVLNSKPRRSTFGPPSRPLSKSSSFSIARRPDSLIVPHRQISLERRPSLMSRLRTPSPPRSRSPSPQSKISSQIRSKSPLKVVDDIFQKYLINYDKRYLSDPLSESKYGKYLYPPKSYEYDYIKRRENKGDSDLCAHRFEQMTMKSRNVPYFSPRDKTFDTYGSSDSLSLKTSNDNTLSCGFNSPRSNYSSQWRDWSHYRERYEHPSRCANDVNNPCYSDDYFNHNYSSNKYSRTVPRVTVDSTYANKLFPSDYYNKLQSSSAKSYFEDFPDMESRYKWNEIPTDYLNERSDPGEDDFKKKDTFRMPQTPKKVSFSNECLYDERLESETGSSYDDYNTKELSDVYNKDFLETKTLPSNNSMSPLNKDSSFAHIVSEGNNNEICSEIEKTQLSTKKETTDLGKYTSNLRLDEESEGVDCSYPLKNYSTGECELKADLAFAGSFGDNHSSNIPQNSEPFQQVLDDELNKKSSPKSSKEDLNIDSSNFGVVSNGNNNCLDDKLKKSLNIISESGDKNKSKIKTDSELSKTPYSSEMNSLPELKSSTTENKNNQTSNHQFKRADVEENKGSFEKTNDIQLHSSQEKLSSKAGSVSDLVNESKALQQTFPNQYEESVLGYPPDKFDQLHPQELDVTSKNNLPDSHINKLDQEEGPEQQYENSYKTELYDNDQAQYDQYQPPVTEDLTTNHEKPQTAYDSRVYSQENIAQNYPQQLEAYEQFAEGEFQQQPTDSPEGNYGPEDISGYQAPVPEQYPVDGYIPEEQYQPNKAGQYEENYGQNQVPADGSIQQYEPDFPATYPKDQYDQSGNVLDQTNLPEQYDQQQLPEYNQYDQNFDQQQPQPYDTQIEQSFDQLSHSYDQQPPQTFDPQSPHQSFDQQSHPYDQQQTQQFDPQSQHQSFDQQQPQQFDPQSQHQSFDQQSHPYDQQQPQQYDPQSQHQSFDQQSHPYDQQKPQQYDPQSQHQSFDQQSHPYDQQPQQYDQYSEQEQPAQYDQYNPQPNPQQYNQVEPQQYGSQQHLEQYDQYDQQPQPYDQYAQQPQNYDQYDPTTQPLEYDQYDQPQPQQYNQQYDQQPDQYGNYDYGYERQEGEPDNTAYPPQAQPYTENNQPYQGDQAAYNESGAYADQQQSYAEPGYLAQETGDITSLADNRQPLINQGENIADGFQAQPVARNQVTSGEAPDLSRVLESDSESAQAPAAAVSHDDSSDFDFSSGKK